MVLLGQHLGASTRLDELDKPQAAESLRRWFRSTWGNQTPARRDSVDATLAAAFAYWRSRGWLTGGDPTQGDR